MIDDIQFGYMPGKGTTDAIPVVRHMTSIWQRVRKLILVWLI